jgi:hypothetical protein
MAEEKVPQERSQEPPKKAERRAYTRPRLIEYGSVAKLTQGNLSVGSDFPQSGFKNRQCL